MVGEPSVEETVEILKGLRDRYEAHHKVVITDEALVAAAKLGDRYISDRFLPDKAVDLIDEAASRVRLQATLPPQSIRDVENEIRKVKQEKDSVVKSQEFEKAAQIRDREEKLRLEKQRLEQEWAEKKKADADKVIKVTEDDVAHIVSSWTKIPVSRLDASRDDEAARHGRPAAQADHRPGRRRSTSSRGRSAARAPGSRTRSARSARSSSSARPASARPKSRARWPSTCSTTPSR